MMTAASIYLVDDHPMLREGLKAALHAAGHRVVGESDEPTQALAGLRRLTPDLLLLDINLGNRSGLELLAEMQRRQLAIPTLVLTMSAQPRHVAEALELGAIGYMLKGASGNELLQAIGAVRRGVRWLAPELAGMATQVQHARHDRSGVDTLSVRERQIVVMVVRGRSSQEIGIDLHLSPKTVDTYRSRLMTKLGVRDVPALVRLAIRAGLIDSSEP
jgi:two-component system, NarL family, invasion response regulator UvrY